MWQVIAILCAVADGHMGQCDRLVLPRSYSTMEECRAARDRQPPAIQSAAAAFASHAGFGAVTLIVRCDVPPAQA